MGKFVQLIPFEEALTRISSEKWKPLETEVIDPEESLGRVVAMDVYASEDFPAWNRSLVDGYAVRSSTTAGASETNPLTFDLNGIVEAGASSFTEYKGDSCTEIYTGGILPDDYDAVIMAEDGERDGNKIRIYGAIDAWKNVERQGDDLQSGAIIVRKSNIVRPWHISAMVSSEVEKLEVYRKLKIAVLSTGNELFPGSTGHIRNTTQMLYRNYLNRTFMDTCDAGVAHDDYREISSMAADALKKNDCLIVTGGTSLGGKDEVPEAISALGEVVFAGSMIRPGRTLTLYIVDGKPVFSVSGIPVPSLLSFDIFFEHFLLTLIGLKHYRDTVTGRLSQALTNKAGYAGIYRVKLTSGEDGNRVELIKTKGTGTLNSLLNSNGTLLVPGHVEGLDAGSLVQVKLFGDAT